MNDFPKNKSKKINNLKLPPQSDDAERSVLGGLMLVGEAWDKVADLLSEEDFYRNDHSLIFKAIRALSEENKPCDVITVGEWLDLHQLLEDAGGEDYLIEIASNVPGAANIKAYAEIVREKSVLRQLIQIGNQLTEKAFNPEGKNSDDLLEEAEKDVFGIREQTLKTKSGFQDIKTLLRQVIVNIEEMSTSDGAMTGIPTGFTDFDKKTNGLQKSDLIIVAGRPAMGKTSFAVNIAEKVAIKEGKSVAIFSMEMSSVQLAMRMMASLSRINSSRLKSGQLHDEEWPRIVQVNHLLSNSKIFIDDTPALSPMEVRARCRRLQRQHGLDLVVIDYLQLMQVKGSENRVNEISEISRSLKGLAKELDIPVIALSQLNRSLEQRPNKRPVMSDLRECVTGDTKVVLSDGSRIPIEDLVGTKPKLFALNQKDKIIVAQSDKVWKVGQKKVYKLHLASGRSIKATAEHRFKVDLSWKKVKDIQIGNRLALANHIPEPNKNGKSHAKLLNNNELKQHANNDIFWDKVVLIEECGIQDVYDLTVPKYENWLADGIISHNSGAIEQDADLIVFIYRDEVYNEDSMHKGKAEIILGKHRHGSTGMIPLTFLGEFTKFENFLNDIGIEDSIPPNTH